MNKLLSVYNNTYYRSFGKKLVKADYSALAEKTEMNAKSPKFKFGDTVRIIKYKNTFSKGHYENWSILLFITDSVLKTNPWSSIIEDSNREKNNRKFLWKGVVVEKTINALLCRTR